MTVCELSEDFRISQTKLLFSDSYIYWTGTVQDGTGGAIYDQVWRVSADGGEAEQLSALGNEAENASYSLYYRDSEGYFYYYTSYYTSEHTRKQYFARSKDFADEKILRYIRSYNSGKVTEVDLRTLQTKTYTLGPKAEISALFGVFGDQLLVGTKTTDLDRVSQIGKGGFESYDIDTGAGFFFDNPYCEYGTVTTK